MYAACPEGTQANTKEKRISLTCAHCWFYGFIQLLLLNTLRERCLQNVASLIILGLELFAGHRTLAQLPNVLLEKWKRKNMQRICIQYMQWLSSVYCKVFLALINQSQCNNIWRHSFKFYSQYNSKSSELIKCAIKRNITFCLYKSWPSWMVLKPTDPMTADFRSNTKQLSFATHPSYKTWTKAMGWVTSVLTTTDFIQLPSKGRTPGWLSRLLPYKTFTKGSYIVSIQILQVKQDLAMRYFSQKKTKRRKTFPKFGWVL